LRQGTEVPGFKIVLKRSRRKWKEEDPKLLAKQILGLVDLEPDDVFTLKVKSPAQIDKLLPKAKREDIEILWEKPQTGYALAPSSDPRPPAAVKATDQFDEIPEGDGW
jgi:Protein of unknown function (DUF2800)